MKPLLFTLTIINFLVASCQQKSKKINFDTDVQIKQDESRTFSFEYERIRLNEGDLKVYRKIEKNIDKFLESKFVNYQNSIDDIEKNPSRLNLYRDYYQADFRILKVQPFDTLLFVIYDCIDVYFSLSKYNYWHETLCFSLNTGNMVNVNIADILGLKSIDKERFTKMAENIAKDSISESCGFKRSLINNRYLYVIDLEPKNNLIPIDNENAYLYFSYLGFKDKQKCTQLEKWEENISDRPKFIFKVKRKDLESLK